MTEQTRAVPSGLLAVVAAPGRAAAARVRGARARGAARRPLAAEPAQRAARALAAAPPRALIHTHIDYIFIKSFTLIQHIWLQLLDLKIAIDFIFFISYKGS